MWKTHFHLVLCTLPILRCIYNLFERHRHNEGDRENEAERAKEHLYTGLLPNATTARINLGQSHKLVDLMLVSQLDVRDQAS